MNLYGLAIVTLLIAGSIYLWRNRHVDEPFFADEYRLAPDLEQLVEYDFDNATLVTARGVELKVGSGWWLDDIMLTVAEIDTL